MLTASLDLNKYRRLTDEVFYQQTVQGAKNRSAYFDGTRMIQEVEAMFEELART